MVRTQADNKGISMNDNIPGEIVINSDKDMIETILRNLITNAVKYTSINGLVCVDSEVKGNDIRISVKDTGVGMDPKTLSALFSINKSVQTTSGTSGEKGSGLGLMLCKEFAEKLGGQLKVESQVDKGSVFTISLPNSVIYSAIG
jgi:signal transduction histidine kinase